jgi:hypothetical protein
MKSRLLNVPRRKRGQGLVEYALIIAGCALVCAVSVNEFGHKTQDLISAVAVMLPGAHSGDNAPIVGGHLIETTINANGDIVLDTNAIATQNNVDRLGLNLYGPTDNGSQNGLDGMIVESR